MAGRWRALAVLFLARAAMGFQFQAVAASAPLAMARFDVGLGEIGLLIGLYMAPGVVVALPGGALGRRFGERRAASWGLLAMAGGGALMAAGGSWEAQLAGRLLAGAGGVLLNVVMTKMIADWFAGREIATAMGIFVNSWPVGIALALLALPPLAAAEGLGAVHAATAAYALAGLVLVSAVYRAPEAGTAAAGPGWFRIPRRTMAGALSAGSAWGLYNAALAIAFGFGPILLVERGRTLEAAGATASLTLWSLALSVPTGGWLADRLGRRDLVLVASVVGFAAALVAVAAGAPAAPAFIAIGLIGGIAAGPMMSLPAAVSRPEDRAAAMGLFYTTYYAWMLAAPPLAGAASEGAGGAAASFVLAATLLAGSLGAFAICRARIEGAAAA